MVLEGQAHCHLNWSHLDLPRTRTDPATRLKIQNRPPPSILLWQEDPRPGRVFQITTRVVLALLLAAQAEADGTDRKDVEGARALLKAARTQEAQGTQLE